MQHLVFGPFRLDPQARQLWRGDAPVPLQARPLAVLSYLSVHPDRVVTAEELLQQVWQGTYVTKTAVKVCMRAIREALGEGAEHPVYLETVGREGYRFRPAAGSPPLPPLHGPSLMPLVGRDQELQTLDQGLASALRGRRQVIFVTGDPGLGKTTLVDRFLARVAASGQVSIGRGQCVEQYGEGEAYLPVLEALGHWCRGPGGQQVLTALQRYAPTWLVQMPALLTEAEQERLQRQVAGATRERMIREMAEALEALTADRALVLVLEDVQWSDKSTVELLAYLAQRRAAARLLVLGTYRPTDLVLRAHPLHGIKQELQAHRQCAEIRLAGLTPTQVQTYVTQRLDPQVLPPGLAAQVYERTDGHPLFMVHVVEQYVQQGRLEAHVPESVQELIGRQVARLPAADQRVLAVGSVVGREFAVATVAAVLQEEVDELEDRCVALAQTSPFLEAAGLAEWPDGTLSGRYRFRHALYQQVLYGQLAEARRVRLHRVIGAHEEHVHSPQAGVIAAELAMHFERGREYPRAVHYLQQAAENAAQRYAHYEVIALVTQGLGLLVTLPETPARAQQELALLIALGPTLIYTKGLAAPEVEQTYVRARALCHQVGETSQLWPTLWGLYGVYQNRGVLPMARELGEQIYQLAQRRSVPTYLLEAHDILGNILFFLGEYAAAWTHFTQAITLTSPTEQWELALRHGTAPGVRCLAVAANALWCLGFPAQAVQRSQEALALAQALAHPQSLVLAQHYAAFVHYRRRDMPAVQTQAEALLTLATAQEFPVWAGFGTCWQGWALAMQDQSEMCLAQIHQGIAAILATGQTLSRPFGLVLLAEVMGHLGQGAAGLHLLEEALTAFEASGRGDMLPEAYRLQGALLLRQASPEPAQAEACFQHALTIACRQQAKSWELRAATSLARLWQQQGKREEARQVLGDVYGWFTEGFDTADLKDAKALLDALA